MEFLELLDQLHKSVKDKHAVSSKDRNFRSYHAIVFDGNSSTGRFIIQKNLIKAKLLIVDGKQKVYLSDDQIIQTILEMPASTINWFLTQMINLYNESGVNFGFSINEQHFDFVGIPYFPSNDTILLPSDTYVTINEFIAIINFIFAKDIAWERIPLSANATQKGYNKDDFSKRTLCKYISLIDYYGLHTSRSIDFFDQIKYPLFDEYPGAVENEKTMFAHTELFDISKYM